MSWSAKFNSFLALALGKTRIHGSKHGNPASADAAEPQGFNDQVSLGLDS
jgi:hypothetical protein